MTYLTGNIAFLPTHIIASATTLLLTMHTTMAPRIFQPSSMPSIHPFLLPASIPNLSPTITTMVAGRPTAVVGGVEEAENGTPTTWNPLPTASRKACMTTSLSSKSQTAVSFWVSRTSTTQAATGLFSQISDSNTTVCSFLSNPSISTITKSSCS